MYKIKEKPSDFIVYEITPDKIVVDEDYIKSVDFNLESKGKFLRCVLVKENIDTIKAIKIISRRLRIKDEKISIAGVKDKKAVTYQMISLMYVKKEELDSHSEYFRSKKMLLKPISYGDKVYLGELWGNKFVVVIRDFKGEINELGGWFLNYFGEQRFSEGRTPEIGRLIISRKWKKAIETILDSKETIIEKEIKSHLEKNRGDYINALKLIPLKLRKMYIHAYQSFIFNETLKKAYAGGIIKKETLIPLVGYGYKNRIFKTRIDEIVEEILKKEEIRPEMFEIEEMKDISSEGLQRKAYQKYYDLKILERKKDSIKMEFKLPKGCYATVFLDQLLTKK